jgi:hypothetical protein
MVVGECGLKSVLPDYSYIYFATENFYLERFVNELNFNLSGLLVKSRELKKHQSLHYGLAMFLIEL